MSKKTPPMAVTAQRPTGRRGAPEKPVAAKPALAPAKATEPFRLTPYTILRPIASLKLTVALMLMSMFLVYAGTMAQVERGIHHVVDEYFWSSFVYVPLGNLVPDFLFPNFFFNARPTLPTLFGYRLGIPFIGGKLLGLMLLVNLLAAHTVRFKMTWKRAGIWTIHGGLILLLVGEAITREFAEEYRMQIEEGKSSNYLHDFHEVELAFVDISDPATDRVAIVPASRLKPGKRISDPTLPVDVEVVTFMPNSVLTRKMPPENPATKGIGLALFAEEKPVVSGTDTNQMDAPSMYVRLFDRETGDEIGVFLGTTHRDEQRIDINGKPYEFGLRFKRTYLPYTMHLTKFTHDVYEGTDKPKDYRSHIHLADSEKGSDRNLEIYMNSPLRYRGKTFFQTSFMTIETHGMRGTILQVVDNPGAVLPYVSCILVTLGMLMHFGINLTQFMGRRIRGVGVTS